MTPTWLSYAITGAELIGSVCCLCALLFLWRSLNGVDDISQELDVREAWIFDPRPTRRRVFVRTWTTSVNIGLAILSWHSVDAVLMVLPEDFSDWGVEEATRGGVWIVIHLNAALFGTVAVISAVKKSTERRFQHEYWYKSTFSGRLGARQAQQEFDRLRQHNGNNEEFDRLTIDLTAEDYICRYSRGEGRYDSDLDIALQRWAYANIDAVRYKWCLRWPYDISYLEAQRRGWMRGWYALGHEHAQANCICEWALTNPWYSKGSRSSPLILEP